LQFHFTIAQVLLQPYSEKSFFFSRKTFKTAIFLVSLQKSRLGHRVERVKDDAAPAR